MNHKLSRIFLPPPTYTLFKSEKNACSVFSDPTSPESLGNWVECMSFSLCFSKCKLYNYTIKEFKLIKSIESDQNRFEPDAELCPEIWSFEPDRLLAFLCVGFGGTRRQLLVCFSSEFYIARFLAERSCVRVPGTYLEAGNNSFLLNVTRFGSNV